MNQDLLAINTLRALALDAIAKAKEGHPGGPLGMAPMAYVLWTKFLRFNPKNPQWSNRDRFVLSAGHASMLLYGALHLTGFDLTLEDLKNFRQYNSKTPGHPEYGHTPGVETTTGPLGQGFANAVGMALAEAHLGARYNRPGHNVVDHFTYGICSDGDLQEGISHEAASLAGHLGLGKLVMLYDDNSIQLDGPTEWAFSENISQRFGAYGWHVQTVTDGDDDLAGIETAIRAAQLETSRPSLICVKTTIGYGMPKAGTADVHGKAPSLDDVVATKAKLKYPSSEAFFVAPDGAAAWLEAGARGTKLEAAHSKAFKAYAKAFPTEAAELSELLAGKLPKNAFANLPNYDPFGKPVRTRNANGDCINAIAPNLPALMGGSADLSGSNMTIFKAGGNLKRNDFAGRNVHFGVREHAMAAIGNGLTLSGLRPYVATFFTFSDYMKNSIRLAALMNIPTVFVFTHDSIGVGTDGPTHQPIEHLAGLRAIPNLCVLRPADANESATAWRIALERRNGPTALVFTRQDVPVLNPNPEGVAKGAYIAADCEGKPDLILIATGSEVALALEAKNVLEAQGKKTRVVSAPSWDLFAKQPKAYRNKVLPPSVRARVGIEAGSSYGWERMVGLSGSTVCLDSFGASAPDNVVFEALGFSAQNVVQTALKLL